MASMTTVVMVFDDYDAGDDHYGDGDDGKDGLECMLRHADLMLIAMPMVHNEYHHHADDRYDDEYYDGACDKYDDMIMMTRVDMVMIVVVVVFNICKYYILLGAGFIFPNIMIYRLYVMATTP